MTTQETQYRIPVSPIATIAPENRYDGRGNKVPREITEIARKE